MEPAARCPAAERPTRSAGRTPALGPEHGRAPSAAAPAPGALPLHAVRGKSTAPGLSFQALGSGVTVQSVLSRNLAHDLTGPLAWGLAFAVSSLACQLVQGRSGSDSPTMTPVVAVVHLCAGCLDCLEFAVVLLAHFLGAFLAACLTYLSCYGKYRAGDRPESAEGLQKLDRGSRMISGPLRTAQVFAGFPAVQHSDLAAFTDQVTGPGP